VVAVKYPVKAFLVTLAKEVCEDTAMHIENAIRLLCRVQNVEPVPAIAYDSLEHCLVRHRLAREMIKAKESANAV
jgi:hypothetical protein